MADSIALYLRRPKVKPLIKAARPSHAKGNFDLAVQILRPHQMEAIELSALREEEWAALAGAQDKLELHSYRHVSLHTPSRLSALTETELVQQLLPAAESQKLIVVHPDIISDFAHRTRLGAALCIENMDKRKPIGRTADELTWLFRQIPQARLCLDLGHSRQVDPSMHETWQILKLHGHRLAQIHPSEVYCASQHEPLNGLAIRAYQRIAPLIPEGVPIILESPVAADQIANEVRLARQALPSRALISA